MTNILTELLIILLLIFINSILSLSEAAMMSVRKSRLQQRINDGDHRAKKALDLTENPNSFLSTIQIGITLSDVLVGAIGGVAIATFLADLFRKVPALEPYSDALGLVVVVLVTTYLSIVLGELVPKRLGLQIADRIASTVAGPMTFILKLLKPFVWFLGKSTDLILGLLGVRNAMELPVTEEELLVQLEQGKQAGIFEAAEQDMVAGVFALNDRRVNSMMTPRSEIVWLDINDSVEQIKRKIAESTFSRFPVVEDSMDEVLGVVRAKGVLLADIKTGRDLKEIANPAMYIPETAFGSRALELFKESKTDLILIIDEFGVVQGLLTLADVVEEIVGELTTDEPQATQRKDGSWLLDGFLSIEDFKEIFNLRHLPSEEEYETLGGFMMMQLGRIPQVADQFDWSGLCFEVMDMDEMRVDKVLVTTKPSIKTPPDSSEDTIS